MFVASVEAIGRAARRLCSRSRLQRRFCAPPDAYDARDKLHGQLQSDSFNALNQGDCDSRYAFGVVMTYGHRRCLHNHDLLGKVVISAQQLVTCDGAQTSQVRNARLGSARGEPG